MPALAGLALFLAVFGGMFLWMYAWQQGSRTAGPAERPTSAPIVRVEPVVGEPGGGRPPGGSAAAGPLPDVADVGSRAPTPDGPDSGSRAPLPGELDPEPPPPEPPGPGFVAPGGEPPASRPRVAVVIDDWGYGWSAADEILGLPGPLTVAVLPFLPHTQEHARRALAAGHEVILHLPMEPLDPTLPLSEGTIRTDMPDGDVVDAVRRALQAVPGIVGVNNHMGSRATSDPRVMELILATVHEAGYFFLDSNTAGEASVVSAVARRLDVPHAVNHVFLDHRDDYEWIVGRFRRLLRLAEAHGAAIGIGHVRRNTYRALAAMLPEMEARGIELVPLSRLIPMPPRETMPMNVSGDVAGAPQPARAAWELALSAGEDPPEPEAGAAAESALEHD